MDLIVRTEQQAALAVHCLDPESRHPGCDWCGKRNGEPASAHGRWWLHASCAERASKWGLRSMQRDPVEWEFGPDSPAQTCPVKGKPRPAALTDTQIAEVLALSRWGHSQTVIAERLGVNQASVSRAIKKAHERGIKPARVKGQQIDWLGNGEAA